MSHNPLHPAHFIHIRLWTAVIILVAVVVAEVPWRGASEPTPAGFGVQMGAAPQVQPTSVGALPEPELFKRQAAPPGLCGYEDGVSCKLNHSISYRVLSSRWLGCDFANDNQ